MNMRPSTEDRVWAVLSHLSALAFGMGVALPVVGWSDQRRKSNYASFQCLQALGYQSLGFTVWILSFLLILVIFLVVFVVLGLFEGGAPYPDAVINALVSMLSVLIFGSVAIYFLLPLVAAVACALGRDFRYPVLGDHLARYLGYESPREAGDDAWLDEQREFRWVAAMGHFSILILLWGMLAPLTAWILQGRQSAFLKFQSLQALVFQAVTTVGYLVGGLLYFFGMVLLLAGMGALQEVNLSSPLTIVGAVLMGVVFLLAAALILFVPLLHILGQWAGFRLLKGDDYLYPVVGRWVERWNSKTQP